GARLEEVARQMERTGIAEVRPGDTEHQHEDERPDAECAVKIPHEPAPADTPANGQTAAPALNTGPPDDQARHAEQRQGKSPKPVDGPAAPTAEQVVMERHQPRDRADPAGTGPADIGAGIRIEQPLDDLGAARELDFDGSPGIPGM